MGTYAILSKLNRLGMSRFQAQAAQSTTSATDSKYEFKDSPSENRFILKIHSSKAYLSYTKHGDVYDLEHTFVPKRYRGKGIGKILAQNTFDTIASRKEKIVIKCDFLQYFYNLNKDRYSTLLA